MLTNFQASTTAMSPPGKDKDGGKTRRPGASSFPASPTGNSFGSRSVPIVSVNNSNACFIPASLLRGDSSEFEVSKRVQDRVYDPEVESMCAEVRSWITENPIKFLPRHFNTKILHIIEAVHTMESQVKELSTELEMEVQHRQSLEKTIKHLRKGSAYTCSMLGDNADSDFEFAISSEHETGQFTGYTQPIRMNLSSPNFGTSLNEPRQNRKIPNPPLQPPLQNQSAPAGQVERRPLLLSRHASRNKEDSEWATLRREKLSSSLYSKTVPIRAPPGFEKRNNQEAVGSLEPPRPLFHQDSKDSLSLDGSDFDSQTGDLLPDEEEELEKGRLPRQSRFTPSQIDIEFPKLPISPIPDQIHPPYLPSPLSAYSGAISEEMASAAARHAFHQRRGKMVTFVTGGEPSKTDPISDDTPDIFEDVANKDLITTKSESNLHAFKKIFSRKRGDSSRRASSGSDHENTMDSSAETSDGSKQPLSPVAPTTPKGRTLRKLKSFGGLKREKVVSHNQSQSIEIGAVLGNYLDPQTFGETPVSENRPQLPSFQSQPTVPTYPKDDGGSLAAFRERVGGIGKNQLPRRGDSERSVLTAINVGAEHRRHKQGDTSTPSLEDGALSPQRSL